MGFRLYGARMRAMVSMDDMVWPSVSVFRGKRVNCEYRHVTREYDHAHHIK